METFVKKTLVSKNILGAKVNACALSTGFSRMTVTLNLLHFGCFAAGQHVNGCFFANIDVFYIGLHRSLEHIL